MDHTCKIYRGDYSKNVYEEGIKDANSAKPKNKFKFCKAVNRFNKLKNKGIFWSYYEELTHEKEGDKLFLEYLSKYGDFDDLVVVFKLYPKDTIKSVCEQTLKSDKRFIKLNLMLARVFIGMDVESFYFKEVKNARFEKLKMFAS